MLFPHLGLTYIKVFINLENYVENNVHGDDVNQDNISAAFSNFAVIENTVWSCTDEFRISKFRLLTSDRGEKWVLEEVMVSFKWNHFICVSGDVTLNINLKLIWENIRTVFI